MIGDVVAVSIFAAIFISTACTQTVDENSLVPVSKIAGTNLYTGIYYKMSMKTYPYGWVTLAPYGATTYVQIELSPNDLPNYEPGKTLQHNNQWYFEAVGSNVGYTLTNRVKADDVLTYSGWYSTVSNRNGIKASGDAYMIAAQWKLKAIPEEDYYKIESMQYPGCLLTWAWAMHNKYNYYIQLSYTDFKDHSMFSFKLPKITLKANVTNFQFGQLSQEINKVLVDTKTYPNVGRTDFTYPLNETYQTTNSFTFTFDNPIGDVNETTINVNNLNELSETELIFTGGFEANEERSIEIVKGLPFNPQLKVPPYSETEIRVFTIWSKIEVPFTATLILSGTTERIVKDQRAQVQEAPVPADLLKEYLRYEGQDNLEIVSRTGNKLHISVKGTMKANVAYRTNFESKSLTKDDPKVTKATPLVTLNLALGK